MLLEKTMMAKLPENSMANTGLKTGSGQPIFLAYSVKATKKAVVFTWKHACLSDGIPILWKATENTGGVLDFEKQHKV